MRCIFMDVFLFISFLLLKNYIEYKLKIMFLLSSLVTIFKGKELITHWFLAVLHIVVCIQNMQYAGQTGVYKRVESHGVQ